ncbi:MAG: Ig-like domain-containing protein [Bacilli bacterium]|nr:Ig-like domain-containing protein [Bacilli bacterium]
MFKKKSLLILSSIVIGSLILGGCNKGNNEKDPDEGGGGTVIRHDSWANLVSYDYTNLTVLDEDSMLEEGSYILHVGEGKYINWYPIFGEWYHQFFADYNGSNYVYWDYTQEGGTTGWLNYNPEYHVDLTLEHQEFYLPNLLTKVGEDDVEYSAATKTFYVKDSSLAKVSKDVFGFATDHRTFAVIAILVETDLNTNKDRISKVRAFDTLAENSPYVQLTFGNYGITQSQWGFPELPSETTVKDYWTITGKDVKTEVYPSTATITANNVNDTETVKSDTEFDLILEVGDYADVSVLVGPDNINMSYIVNWTPDRSDFIDNEGNPTGEFASQVALFDIKQNFAAGHKYLTAMVPGTVEVYATVNFFKYDANNNATYESVKSNVLKVKVNEPKEMDTSKAVYQFKFDGYKDEYNDQKLGSSSGLFRTRFMTSNLAATSTFNPVSRVTGYHASLLAAGNTDAFEGNKDVLWMTPEKGVNEPLASYIDFDLDDQEVNSIAFNFSLHRQNQLTNTFKNNYKSFKVFTSSNGVDWTLYSDKTDFVRTELNKDEGSLTGMTSHLFELDFDTPVHYIRLMVEAKSFIGTFGIVIDEVTLSAENKTHVDKASVPVTGVSITLDENNSTSVRVNNSISLGYEMNPNNATNNLVYWTSSDASIASITRNLDGTVSINGHKPGEVTITVYTDEEDDSHKAWTDTVTITVLGEAAIPAVLDGNSYSNAEKGVYFTFDASKGTLSATYIVNGVPHIDILNLVNETNGVYTFTSENSKVMIKNVAVDGSSITISNKVGDPSHINGTQLPTVELVKANG